MAKTQDLPAHDAPAMDYAEHEKTFSLFTGLIKWGSVFSIGLTLLSGAVAGLIPWLFLLVVAGGLIVVAARFL